MPSFRCARFSALLLMLASAAAAALPPPPESPRDAVVEQLHGEAVPDPYRWLEEDQAPAVRAWISAQNEYTGRVLAAAPDSEGWKERLTQLYRSDSAGLPMERGGRYFYSRRRPDDELASIYYRQGVRGKEQLLVDPKQFSSDGRTSVALAAVARSGDLAAYSIRRGGADEVSVRLIRPDGGKAPEDELPAGRYFSILLPDTGDGFYYCRHDARGPRLLYHRFGTPVAEDRVLFGEAYGPEYLISATLSPDQHYLLMTVSLGSAAEKTELHYIDLQGDANPKPLITGITGSFTGAIVDGELFALTDYRAPNGRIIRVSLHHPEESQWREVVPEPSAGSIQQFSLVGGRIGVLLMKEVQSSLAIFDPSGEKLREVRFPEIGSTGSLYGRWESDEAFFSFSSFHIPPTIYRYDLKSDRREIWHRLDAPINSDELEVVQKWATSRDGARIPYFLLHRKDLKRDGRRPTLLYAYGGFRNSLTPGFSPMAAAWAERGGIWAVANLRGGGEFGEEWHRAGMRERKQNVFDDYYAVAESLIAEGYTSSQRLGAMGGSNGGLLVGAALTQRPELFGAVVCTYPLLDMVRYHRFLVARFWIPEYGSSEDPEQFRYIYAYSPYHRVKKGEKYPAVLFITGDSDTRVAPLHARKMAAMLQWATASGKPVLLDYDTEAGHSGGKPIARTIEDVTRQLQFLGWQLNLEPPPAGRG